jgi:hypothetical protein
MEKFRPDSQCSASTIKGSFAGEFVIRHIASDTSPD